MPALNNKTRKRNEPVFSVHSFSLLPAYDDNIVNMVELRTPSIDYIDNDENNINELDFYQKYRPMTFDDVYGQKNVVEALRSYVKQFHETGKLPPAIILAGLHGSGKTTLAFILARALNCEHVDKNWNPCNECDSCRGIVMDANAAITGFKYQAMSNLVNVIQDVRDLIAQSYMKSSLKKSVFVLDEVQALNKSQGAWDCFLNPIESGTPTLFIFCTTEPNKIAKAVRSRCSSWAFGPISKDNMMNLCVSILKAEGYSLKLKSDGSNDGKTVTKAQIIAAIERGNGSARDTLTALSTIVAGAQGIANSTNNMLLRSVFKRKRGETIRILTDAASNGESMDSIASTFADTLGRIIALSDGIPASDSDPDIIRNIAKMYHPRDFAPCMTFMGDALAGMAWGAGDPRVYVEIAFMKTIDLLDCKHAANDKKEQ